MMSSKTCRKVKALLFIIMLAVAEARNIQRELANPVPNLSEETHERVAKQMRDEGLLDEQVELLHKIQVAMSAPDFGERAKHVAQQVEMLMTDRNFQEQSKRIAQQMQGMMDDPNSQMQARQAAQHLQAMIAEPTYIEALTNVQSALEQMPVVQDNSKSVVAPMADQLVDGLMDNLFDRALKAEPLHHTDLENSTLAKGHPAFAQNPQVALQPEVIHSFASSARLAHLDAGRRLPSSGSFALRSQAVGSTRSSRMPVAVMARGGSSVHRSSDMPAATVAPGGRKPIATSQHDAFSKILALAPPTVLVNLIAAAQAVAADVDGYEFKGSQASYYTVLFLFLITVPGVWSIVKRAPTATKKRITFEMKGPSAQDGKELDTIAREVAGYFKKYNYRITSTGEVITFTGTYEASKGQAAATTFYFFWGLVSIALVLTVTVPDIGPIEIGSKWYGLTLLSPLAYFYYDKRGTRDEEMRIKMVTSDDNMLTDLVIEGDREEIDRFARELQLVEKGKIYVEGFFDQRKAEEQEKEKTKSEEQEKEKTPQ